MAPHEGISIFSLAFSLFFIFNSMGQVPVFMAVLAPYDAKRQRKIIFRELVIALAIILLFVFFGSGILNALHISKHTIGVVGGLLLLIIALQMIFPKDSPSATKGLPRHEPMIVPLAMPGLAGPGSIAAVMIYASKVGAFFTAGAFILAWIPSLILLLASSYLKHLLGEKGLQALEKLGGMLIALIGAQMITFGIMELVKDHFFG
jgi:multiple antibiotic resistance protein